MSTLVLIGNPNVGKSAVFGALTGRYVTVSNYPGTTVEVSHGTVTVEGEKLSVLDTPGLNTLLPLSEEERVTRDILLRDGGARVVQVADAKNLRRALLLTLQLIETGVPLVLDLNMEDEEQARGIRIDKKLLAEMLGIPVIGTVAVRGRGIGELKKTLGRLAPSPYRFSYSSEIEEAVRRIEPLLPSSHLTRRSLALMILAGDPSLTEWVRREKGHEAVARADEVCREVSTPEGEPLGSVLNRQRLEVVEGLMKVVWLQRSVGDGDWLARLGRLAMHPFWGVPVLVGVLGLFYLFVGKFGAQVGVDWLENGLFGQFLNPWAERFFSRIFFFSPFLRDLLVGPYGLITMALTYALAIIFPIVLTFFTAFSLIEDTGYLPRLAVMLNRLFKGMGLNGKAVVPMVLGLGCDTMATMSARILDTRKERILVTLLLALGIPCSAQLGIILAMLAALPFWATLLWLGVIGGSLIAVGFLAAKILPGGRSEFVMEIPPLRRPILFNIFVKTTARLEWYLKEVVPIFILGTLFLFLLDRWHLLPKIQEAADPLVVGFLGLPPEATEAFLVGFLRRDYGATHFFDLFGQGRLDAVQAIVSLIVMTLFVPCLANLLMIVKERGWRTALAIVGFIYPFAFLVGGVLNGWLR